jgi:hypothetical protein
MEFFAPDIVSPLLDVAVNFMDIFPKALDYDHTRGHGAPI